MRKKKKSQNVSERKAISFKSTVSLKTYFLQITYDLVFRKNHRQREISQMRVSYCVIKQLFLLNYYQTLYKLEFKNSFDKTIF
jgi:hypothetical protein